MIGHNEHNMHVAVPCCMEIDELNLHKPSEVSVWQSKIENWLLWSTLGKSTMAGVQRSAGTTQGQCWYCIQKSGPASFGAP